MLNPETSYESQRRAWTEKKARDEVLGQCIALNSGKGEYTGRQRKPGWRLEENSIQEESCFECTVVTKRQESKLCISFSKIVVTKKKLKI